MKPFLSLILLFSLMASGQAPQSKFIITLKDKTTSDYSLSHPERYLSAKAIERRNRYDIAITASDLPLVASYLETIKSKGAKIVYQSRWLNTIIVETTNSDFPDQVASLPFVARIQGFNDNKSVSNERTTVKPFFQNESIRTAGSVINLKSENNTDVYNYGNAFNQIHMLSGEQLHNLGFQGQGMTIAVIDAGFNSADILPVFDSLWTNNQILGTHDFVEPNNNVFNTGISSHGMMVLSTMGGNLPGQIVGTAPKASYWLLRSEYDPTEYIIEEYYWVNAAEFADSVGADLINSSLGYTEFYDTLQNHTYADMDGNSTVITIGADLAAQKGILVVNSAGNSGGDLWNYIGAPADGDSVFSIGAVDSQGNYAYFSSTGPTYDGRIKPNVAAQGYGTAVANPSGGVTFGSGTSFSSPIIAGMTACLWQANRSMSNMDIINALQRSGNQALNPDSLLGYGIPNYMTANVYLGLNDPHSPDNQHDVNIQPNPFSDSFTIGFNIPLQKGNVLISLKTVSGLTVYEGSFPMTGSRLAVNKLPNLTPGIYVLFIQSGNSKWVKKVVRY
jgi:serine protease AprX